MPLYGLSMLAFRSVHVLGEVQYNGLDNLHTQQDNNDAKNAFLFSIDTYPLYHVYYLAEFNLDRHCSSRFFPKKHQWTIHKGWN